MLQPNHSAPSAPHLPRWHSLEEGPLRPIVSLTTQPNTHFEFDDLLLKLRERYFSDYIAEQPDEFNVPPYQSEGYLKDKLVVINMLIKYAISQPDYKDARMAEAYNVALHVCITRGYIAATEALIKHASFYIDKFNRLKINDSTSYAHVSISCFSALTSENNSLNLYQLVEFLKIFSRHSLILSWYIVGNLEMKINQCINALDKTLLSKYNEDLKSLYSEINNIVNLQFTVKGPEGIKV